MGMGTPPPVVETSHLVKIFRSRGRRLRALDGVSLAVRRGEVFGLLGANGAGKTTLVKLLLGLARPTEGSVRLRGADPREVAARRRVGYLPEGHRFPDYLPAREALRLFGRLAGVPEKLLASRIDELLHLVELADRGGDRLGTYSKGMTQRLGLAAALVDDPELLFLDEPTDGVDPVGRRTIRDILLACKQRGVTIFINSHLLSEVERTCDRVAILDRGRVVCEGSVEELTRPTMRYTLRFAPGQKERLDLPTLGARRLLASDGHLEVEVNDLEELNRILDAIRAQKVLVAEVQPVRHALEDVFVRVLDQENGQ